LQLYDFVVPQILDSQKNPCYTSYNILNYSLLEKREVRGIKKSTFTRENAVAEFYPFGG
jgi:hypothetical protein